MVQRLEAGASGRAPACAQANETRFVLKLSKSIRCSAARFRAGEECALWNSLSATWLGHVHNSAVENGCLISD